ncbi:cell division protein FtsQ/DivIB [Pseudohaliea rubra]|uniref:Cell division protein FtsQ n=1 Tax=Pseudohaliea rubra DSM 19751 TaxID=1265313 RepID=A0A095VP60_9GAMM|nr:cell division protein FtsQ/DivIB [Pseudohaliea rubra]KGE03262.1 Cell division protein FtsQ [Pseudohaliea rubra DSM 19751]
MAVRRKGKPAASRRQAPGLRARLPGRAAVGRWFNGALLLCALALVAVLAQRAWDGLLARPVGRIAVAGKLENVQRDEVRSVVAGVLDGGFVGADLAALRGHLEALPWVYEAAVRRRWPDTLEITVQEQLPIAHWGEEGFLNHEAEVFRTSAASRWQGLPTLDGPPGSQERLMDYYQRLRDMLAPADLKVTALRQDERGQLEARLADGLRLRLGSEEFLLRVQRFIDLYRDDLQARGPVVASVDLRYASGAAVTFHEPAQVAVVDPERGQ